MRRLALVACAALVLAGCTAPLHEARLEREARKLPLPPGASSVAYGSYCGSGCWGGGDAVGTVAAVYPQGTNVTALHRAFVGVLEAAGWNVTEASEPTAWREDGASMGGLVRARKDDVLAGCRVGEGAEGAAGVFCDVDDA